MANEESAIQISRYFEISINMSTTLNKTILINVFSKHSIEKYSIEKTFYCNKYFFEKAVFCNKNKQTKKVYMSGFFFLLDIIERQNTMYFLFKTKSLSLLE